MGELVDDARLAAELVTGAATLAARMRDEASAPGGGPGSGPAGSDLGVEQKTTVSDVVTAADRAAEALIVERLAQERPDDAVLGEEGASRPGTSGRTWVIDPVDGTYNFVAGLDWWCSALALVEGDPEAGPGDPADARPLLGAVHQAIGRSTFVGGPDLAPTLDGDPLAPLTDRPLAESAVATYLHPPFYRDGALADAFGRAVGPAATVRMLGSGTLDAMAVARGSLHVVVQHSVLPWDRLPGVAIVTGLGGEARRVAAAGVVWTVYGVRTAVAEVCAGLEGR